MMIQSQLNALGRFTPVLCFLTAFLVTACDDRKASSGEKADNVDSGKSKMGLVVLSDVQSSGKSPEVTASLGERTRTLQPGDALRLGETIRCGEFTRAEIRFDGGTRVRMDEHSALLLNGHPTIANLEGTIAISRQVGAPAPFVLELNGREYSVIRGKLVVTGQGPHVAMEVISGEVLRLDNNQYSGTGAREPDAIRPPAGTPAPSTGPVAPLDWSPSISPVESAALIPVDSTIHRGIGTLFARNPRTGKTAQNAMKMKAHLVDIQIHEGVAITEVEERFTNTSRVTVEATYRFLVPRNSEITRLALDVNGRIEEGEVLEKKRAARIFNRIVADAVRPRDPALLEWERGAAFKMKIFPIRPGETRRVFLTYTTALQPTNGKYRYEYPLSNPNGAVAVDDLSLHARIRTRQPMRSLRTPMFESRIVPGENTADIRWEARGQAPSRDFVITFETEPTRAGLRTLVQTEKNGQSYAMFMWQRPPENHNSSAADFTGHPRNVVAMVDVSFGVSREMIALSAATLVEIIGGLAHDDRFNVLVCDSSCRPLFQQFRAPDASAMVQTHQLVTAMEPGGASNLLGNFQQAFAMMPAGTGGTVVYLGDGVATSGELNGPRLVSLLEQTCPEGVRVHTVGVGPQADARVLGRMARAMNGMNYNLSFGESPASASWHLASMFSRDVLLDVRATLTGADGVPISLRNDRVGMWPAGKSLQWVARLPESISGHSPQGILEVSATTSDGREIHQKYSVALSSSDPRPGFVSRLWAAAEIERLEFENGSEADIIALSRQHRIASRLTSWIVLENQRMYDLFNVQRTDAGSVDLSDASFVDAEESEVPDVDEFPSDGELEETRTSAADRVASSSPSRSASGAGMSGPSRPTSSSSAKKRASGRSAGSDFPDDLLSPGTGSAPSKSEDRMKDKAGGGIATGPIRRPRCTGPRFDVNIASHPQDGVNARARRENLKTALDAQLLSRALHRRYVRQLARMADRNDALAAAADWQNRDGYSAEAVRAMAAEVARSGRRQEAARLYSGTSELAPTHVNTHRRVAEMYRELGDYAAAAGHFGAAWSLSAGRRGTTGNADDALNYLFALAMSGQHSLFQLQQAAVASSGEYSRIRDRVAQLVESVHTGILAEWPRTTAKGPLRIDLETSGEDLDVLLVDPWGRVSGGLWRFGTDVSRMLHTDGETLWANSLLEGAYQVVIARTDGLNGPTRGTVTVSLKGNRKKIPFAFTGASEAVATVSYRRLPDKRCYAF